MKNNKALMCLLTASISALAAAPSFASEKDSKKLIDADLFKNTDLTADQLATRQEVKSQVDILLSRKAPMMKLGESVSVVIDNYGREDISLKSSVYEKLGLGAATRSDDSSKPPTAGTSGAVSTCASNPDLCPTVCYVVDCHSACHGACHGARGWR